MKYKAGVYDVKALSRVCRLVLTAAEAKTLSNPYIKDRLGILSVKLIKEKNTDDVRKWRKNIETLSNSYIR